MPEFLTEAKRTEKKSISITLEVLRRISEEAYQYGLIPSLAIEIAYTDYKDGKEKEKLHPVERDWVLIPSHFLGELLDAYRERSGED
jgi:hypothetical protein